MKVVIVATAILFCFTVTTAFSRIAFNVPYYPAISMCHDAYGTTEETEDDTTAISVGYPLGKNDTRYQIYINRKLLTTIKPGERVTFYLAKEAAYQVCLSESLAYRDPITQAPNSRTISVKKGKQYYFTVGSKGNLDYIFNSENGEKAFNKFGDYKSTTPVVFTTVQTDAIPNL